MKRCFFLFLFWVSTLELSAQFTHKIKADSVLMTNTVSVTALNLENSTKDTLGFLFNTGKGRTRFRKGLIKLSDSIYLIGTDTLFTSRATRQVPISKLTPAIATNTINNTNYSQVWQWNSLGTQTALKISSSSNGAASNLQRLLSVNLYDTTTTPNQTTVAGYFSNLHKGYQATNIAVQAIAENGSTNWAGRFTGNLLLKGTDPGISFHLGLFTPGDNYIRRTGTAMFINASGGLMQLINGVDVYRFNPPDGHSWYTGNPTATVKAILRINGHFIIGTTVDSGALFQVNGRSTMNGSLAVGQRSDGPAVSILTIESLTKGFLRPRMTTTQRNAISSPATGLALYNSTLNTNDTYNGSEYVSFGSKIIVPATNTAAGTTGNQTINKISGTVNIAAGGATVTVTNNTATANSIVYASIRTNDTTAYIKNVVPGAGTFTINLGAAATAEVSIAFTVFN